MATVIPKIATAIKKFSGKPLGVMSKALGAASVAAVVYDAHINAKECSYAVDSSESADRFINQYNNYRASDTQSATVSALKKQWYDIQQSFSYYHPISKAKGYLAGFVNTLVSHAPVLALSALALCCKNVGSKVGGVLLSAHSIKTLLCDVVGVGQQKKY